MTSIKVIQILDSRGNPTLKAFYHGTRPAITAAVPSGASTGTHEALELRDGGDSWDGKGVGQAVHNAQNLAEGLSWEPADFGAADEAMLKADGTPTKSRMGANAILAISMLQSRVQAHQADKQLYSFLAERSGTKPSLPFPFANIINGGRHADNALTLQEFMIVPHKADTFAEATRQVVETTHLLKHIITERFGASQTAVGDEGGFAPQIGTAEEACELLKEASSKAGHDLAIAIDAAASEIFSDKGYEISEGRFLSADDLVEYWVSLIKGFPIISLEDPFDQDDFSSFAKLRSRLQEEGSGCQVVGDDLTVTNPDRIRQAAEIGACDCLLLKVNQIGTVSESLEAARVAKEAGWSVMVSHRSGETSDDFIADLSVALGHGQIKLGAPVRGERTAKYNRLLEIESMGGLAMGTLRR